MFGFNLCVCLFDVVVDVDGEGDGTDDAALHVADALFICTIITCKYTE